jgi:hypothetical protein
MRLPLLAELFTQPLACAVTAAGTTLDVPSDLGSGSLFVLLFLTGLGGLLFLLAWLEPPRPSTPPRAVGGRVLREAPKR